MWNKESKETVQENMHPKESNKSYTGAIIFFFKNNMF